MTTNETNPDYISLESVLDTVPLDVVLEKVCKEMGIDRPGGASGRGWSMRSVLMTCPYKYKRLYVDGGIPGILSAIALETGGLLHQLVAFHYLTKMGTLPLVDYAALTERLLNEKVSAEVVMAANRLFEAYIARYESDYLKPLDVEVAAQDKRGNTCRFDLIAEVLDNDEGLIKGAWIVELKSAARWDIGTLEGWKNDGQIIQQMMIWKSARLDKRYGPLQGVLMNLIRKTNVPDFRRIALPPLLWQIKKHAKDLKVWDAMENFYEATGTWPRNRSACVGRYGLCVLFDHCAGG